MRIFKFWTRSIGSWLCQGSVVLLLAACLSAHGESTRAQSETWPRVQVRIVPGLEEPLVATGPTTAAENMALEKAIAVFRQAPMSPADYPETAKPFLDFLAAHPKTAWRLAVQTNLGLGYYRSGYFSRAFASLADAWQAGGSATAPQAKTLADRAAGELARMHARVGDAHAIEKLLAEMGDRRVSGPATELITGAHESLWMFRNDPGKSYLCGPMALKNLLVALKAEPQNIRAMDAVRSGRSGFSLAQVSELARTAGLDHTLVYRAPGTPIPVPSVVNWKVNHYAAIVGEENGRYHIQDPTFASGDLWVTRAAIDSEASGYFLVPKQARTASVWRLAGAEEAQRVYGKGNTTTNSPGSTRPNAPKAHPGVCPVGMCVANAHLMLASINLSDAPVGYRPQIGPSALIRLTYNQREAFQPATFGFFNVGPKWNLNLLSWVQDDPVAPGQNVLRYEAGGGAVDYRVGYTYDSGSGQFMPEREGGAVLWRIPASGAATSYELRMRDGSRYVYSQKDGAATGTRRMFLTRIVDPAGNALVLHYDSQLRLTSMTDATGRDTVFAYGGPSSLSIVRITDPFGRYASLTYTPEGYLASIADVLGMTSSFTYIGSEGLVTSMTTPYGKTRFNFGTDPGANFRFLTITDPLGLTERLEFKHQAPGIAASDPVAPAGVSVGNLHLQWRNSFHWDKHIYPITHTDYTKARIKHWLHGDQAAAPNETSGVIESEKAPLENRVWYTYPGQAEPYYLGSTATPTAIARVLDDGSTQVEYRSLNEFGTPITTTDPVGRISNLTYDASGIDLLAIRKTIAGTPQVVGEFTYNNKHSPLTYRDAAGQVTQFTYNSAGQPSSATDPLGRTTTYTYDGFGRLTVVTNPNGRVQRTLTYDAFDRVATSTDSEGYTLAYAYDALDRVTRITYPDATTTQYTYNRLDRASTKDRLGRVTTYRYDANRQLTQMIDPLGQATTYAYYGTGVLKQMADPKGNVTRWDVDLQSRPIAKHYADGRTETYTYEATTSRLKSMTDALGQTRQFGYTADDRIAAISYLNAQRPTANVSLVYDGSLPRLVSMADGIGTTQFNYQPLGAAGALQLASEDGPYGNDTVAYQYDALGRVIARTVDSAAERFEYDSLGRISKDVNPLGAFNLTYLGQTGQITSQASATVGTKWTYQGNQSDRRLRDIVNTGLARGFAFDTTPENRITGITEKVSGAASQNWAYSYDANDRLTNAQPSSGAGFGYGYDPADNLTSIGGTVATYNSVNQIVSFGGTLFVYDANGNLADDGQRTYQWDAENRLVGIGYKATPGKSTAFRYDGQGRRLAIIEVSTSATTETRYLWCGDTLCQVRSSNDAITKRIYRQGVALAGGSNQYYSRDHLGSVRDVLNSTTGQRISTFDYAPYGASTQATDFGFAGMFKHSASGLYLTRYRVYEPVSGRWLSRDPIFEIAGPNLYSYVGANPVSHTDPLGLLSDCEDLSNAINNCNSGKCGLIVGGGAAFGGALSAAAGAGAFGSLAGTAAAAAVGGALVSGGAVYAVGAGAFALGSVIEPLLPDFGSAAYDALEAAYSPFPVRIR